MSGAGLITAMDVLGLGFLGVDIISLYLVF